MLHLCVDALPAGFGEDRRGELYVMGQPGFFPVGNDGAVYRIVPADDRPNEGARFEVALSSENEVLPSGTGATGTAELTINPGQREVWEKVVDETTLERVMTREPLTAAPTTTLVEALKIFVEEGIGSLPVLEEGRLVGIVTARDLFRASLDALGGGQG